MRVFIDFEASSLGPDGYPIEVAWVFEDGRFESHLIRPAAHWTDWDPAAEAIHGISRDVLAAEGRAHVEVAQRMAAELSGHEALASAPSLDGKWLSRLLRAAGLAHDAIRLRDSDDARAEVAMAVLAPEIPSSHLHRVVRQLLASADVRFASDEPDHRALPDARRGRDRWLAVLDLAHAHAAAAHNEPPRN